MVDFAAQNLELLSLMNRLTNHLETDSINKTYILRGLQGLVVLMIFISLSLATVRLFRREKYYSQLMEKTTDIVISIDMHTNQITFVSSSVTALLGWRQYDVVGQSSRIIFVNDSIFKIPLLLKAFFETGALTENRCEVELLCQDGEVLHADMVLSLTTAEDGNSQELTADIREISE